MVQAQTILIPNGGFDNNTSGWSVAGNNVSISSFNELFIAVSGIYSENFTLTSSQFYLDANKTYVYHHDYKHSAYDIMMGDIPLGNFDSVILKDLAGNTIMNISIRTCQAGINDLESCSSNSFNIPNSGTYYIEYMGQMNPDVTWKLDNVGFEEDIVNTFTGTVTLDINNDNCASSTTKIANFPMELNESTGNTTYNTVTDQNGDFIIRTSIPTGNFITQINQALYSATPSNYTNLISSGMNNVFNQDFCVSDNSIMNDVEVRIIPTTQSRPGFNTSYQLQYTNIGTTTLSGTLGLTYDNTKVSYLYASTTPSSLVS